MNERALPQEDARFLPRFLQDWPLYRDFYSDSRLAEILSEKACLTAWLTFERTVAEEQGALGVISRDAAEAVAGLRFEDIDYDRLLAETRKVGRPILPLVDAMRRALPGKVRGDVHYGLTTQDVIDSGHAMLIRDGAAVLDDRIASLVALLAGLARTHAGTPMLARTIGQAARPTTFGFRLAVWVAEVVRHRRRIAASARAAACIQLGGAVGTLAGQYGQGRALRLRVANRLGLGVDPITTQSARDNTIDFLLVLANLGAGIEKIARELAFLAASGIGEIRFNQPAGSGASSAMPHKANPSGLEFAEAAGGLAKTRGASALDAAAHRGDREGGVWLREWPTLVETMQYAAAAVMHLQGALAALEVDADRMRAALEMLPDEARAGDDTASAAAETAALLDELEDVG